MFAQMMIPHHAQAVQMSDIVLAKEGTNDQVRSLAGAIRDAQEPEIVMMSGWLTGVGTQRFTDSHGGNGHRWHDDPA